MSHFAFATTGVFVSTLLLTACNPTPSNTRSPAVSNLPEVTPQPSAAIKNPTPDGGSPSDITPAPQTSASPQATEPPTPPTEATASPSPSASSSAAIPPAQEDISVVEKTTFNGKVFDDSESPLDEVKVVARSLNSSVVYTAETTTAGGAYAFNNAPAGVQLEITASLPGHTTRRRVEVLKSNKDGDPNANRYDFGSSAFGVTANALSDKPEVIAVTPARNASGVDASTSFVLTFSEPMDRQTVVDNFELRAYSSEKLSVDTSSAPHTLTGSNAIDSVTGTRIWDKSAFSTTWNNNDTEVTFTFRAERHLPTDTDSDNTPDYQVSLERQDKSIRDKSGISRNSDYFKLTEGDFERTYKFAVNTDEIDPGVISLTASSAQNSGNTNGDTIKILFTEPMVQYTLGATIAGGMGGNASQAAAANNSITGAQAAANYLLSVNRNGTLIYDQIAWSTLGGSAVFDSNDTTHRTVLLLAPTLRTNATVDSRPESGDTAALTAFFTDGSSQTVSTGTFVRSGPGLSNNFDASYTIAASGSSQPIHLEFTYTDGSKESLTTDNLDTSPSASDLKAILDNLTNGSPWTVTDSTGGDLITNDTLTLRLDTNATRLGTVPVNGDKTIAYVRFLNTAGTAFANDALGQVSTSTETLVVPVNGDTGVLSAALNQGLDGQGTAHKFTVSESTNISGRFETGDSLNINIQGSPTINGRSPVRFQIAQSGMFASDDLNAPTEGLALFVGATGTSAELYRPGDNVFVQVRSTVVDPAGNSLDTRSESANASAN